MNSTLPITPFLISPVTSDLASSTSARTRVDICAVALLTSWPIEASCGSGSRSDRGIDETDPGTPGTVRPLLRSVIHVTLREGRPSVGTSGYCGSSCHDGGPVTARWSRPVGGSVLLGQLAVGPPAQRDQDRAGHRGHQRGGEHRGLRGLQANALHRPFGP